MAGYLGTKAVLLSTTAADVVGNAEIGGDLTVGGNVGIGTSSPAKTLHLKSTSPNIYFEETDIPQAFSIGSGGGKFFVYDETDAQQRLTIDSSGNVGIGTSSPSTKIDAVGSTSNSSGIVDTLRLRNTGVAGGDGAKIQFTAGTSTSGAGIGSGGVALNSADLRFYSGGNTERMRIDASGNVGIGTSPSTASHIKDGNGGLIQTIEAGDSSSAYTKYINSTTGSGAFTDGLLVGLDTDESATFWLYESNHMKFGTAGTERMRIDSSGNMRLSANTSYLEIAPNANWGRGIRFGGNGSVSDATYANICTTNGNIHIDPTIGVFGTYINWYSGTDGVHVGNGSSSGYGQIRASAFTTLSDYRLKENVVPLAGAADRLMQIPVCRFNFIADPDTTVDGFLAHEAQEVVPEAVTGAKDAMRDEQYEVTPAVYEDVVIPAVLDEEGNELQAERTERRLVSEAVMGTRSVPDYQGIDQSKLVPLLTAALQEALTEIADLKARVTALEAV